MAKHAFIFSPSLPERESAFTFIEILVVMVILGILSAIAVPFFVNEVRTAGRDEHVIADTVNIALKATEYRRDYNRAPASIADLPSLKLKGEGNTFALVGKGNITCVLGSHPGSNYILSNPHVVVVRGFIIDNDAKQCPFDTSSATWR